MDLSERPIEEARPGAWRRRMLRGPAGTARVVCLILALGGVVFLLVGDKPWGAAADDDGWKADTVRGLWFGAAAWTGIFGLLALSAGWWARRFGPGRPLGAIEVAGLTAGGRIAFWSMLAGIVVLAGALRWNLAHRSLWWDELWNMRQAAHGTWKVDEDTGERAFSETSWARCLWYYQKPTNHVPAALGMKASVALRNEMIGAAEEGRFSDIAVRLPTFIASLLSAVAVAMLLRRWGLPWAGIAAALLLAIHPWHVRYGVDARAYSYLVLWMLAGAHALTSIFEGGLVRVRHWAAFGASLFLMVWTLPNGVFFAFGFFLAACALVFMRWRGGADRIAALGRLFAAAMTAAAVFAVVAGPNVAQAARWLDTEPEPALSGKALVDTGAQLLFGTPWNKAEAPESAGLVSVRTTGLLLLWAAAAALVFAVFGIGAFRIARASATGGAALAAICLGAALYLLATWLRHDQYYHRYVICLIVPFVACVGAGILWPRAKWYLALPILILYPIAAAPQLRVLMTRPYAPIRDVAEYLDEAAATSVGYGLGGRIVEVYRPEVDYILEEPGRSRLEDRMRAARAEGRKLLVYYGYASFNRAMFPSAFELLDDPKYFRETGSFAGIEPDFYYRVFEYTGAEVPPREAAP